ncbi:hypothetical protein CI109_105516 [Kwoniella shandongensis]|uniref:Uncharacterized protein n=1 Tax=Kwoniella shandongensis TaxID=1734106 RepID=A0A5M6C2T2_9TREE|nr:uncharacterized protein CI109_002237 [Kwoniella shandongensis]KAA5529344.1 hypothetical protein CI109_002237 [Kwoniella shandongensis]
MSFRSTRPLYNALRSGSSAARATRRPISRNGSLPTFAVALTVLGVAGAGTIWLSPSAEGIRDSLKSPFLVHADSAPADFRDDPKSKAPFRVDPDTSIPFPLSLSVTTPSAPLTLVGLGVRKVSFLRVKVYSAGFYLDERFTGDLHNIPGWHSFTAQHLLTPPTNNPSDPLGAPQLSGEALMRSLLDRPIACAVRIVPNRNTDFGHLRDAFTRALTARQKLARAAGSLSESDETRITESIQLLKSFFPAQTVQKGKDVVLVRPPEGGLVVEFEGKILGRVNDPWIGKELMLTYFADKNVVSDILKEDVANGLEKLIRK